MSSLKKRTRCCERRESRACEASQHRQTADRSNGTQQALIHAQFCPRREPAGQRGGEKLEQGAGEKRENEKEDMLLCR